MDEEGISTEYRRQLAENFFYKFFLHVAQAANASRPGECVGGESSRPTAVVGNAGVHRVSGTVSRDEADHQAGRVCPGLRRGKVHAGPVAADRRPARGDGKKFSPACTILLHEEAPTLEALEELLKRQYPDFKAFITVADIPKGGHKLIGMGDDDPVFSDGVVTSVGAPIGLAVAETIATAREAAAFIEQECIAYEDLPAVLTLDEAIEQNTAMPMIRKSKDPDEDVQQRIPAVTRAGSDLDWLRNPKTPLPDTEVASGSLRTGPQAHFYLETMCALAIPGMYDQMTVYNSTQNPNGDQSRIARALGSQSQPDHDHRRADRWRVRRQAASGGLVARQAAVAARKLNRPVRLLYDRATDMLMVGKRHPYLGDYHMAFTREGIIKGLHLDLQSDAGDTYDCSFAVMDLSLLQSDGCYCVETLQANGTVYRTNKTSNTAFRTFGNIQPYGSSRTRSNTWPTS